MTAICGMNAAAWLAGEEDSKDTAFAKFSANLGGPTCDRTQWGLLGKSDGLDGFGKNPFRSETRAELGGYIQRGNCCQTAASGRESRGNRLSSAFSLARFAFRIE